MSRHSKWAFAAISAVLMGTGISCMSSAQQLRQSAGKQAEFYLHDGDRVVFYGDSITDQRLYTTYIETYCATRFPGRRFTFVHSGWGGDRVTGGGGGPIDVRLKRDVLPYKPTVITICLGMNDGSYRAFDKAIFDTYIKGYRHILDKLKAELPAARITLLTAPAFDDVTRPPNFPGGYNETLKRYGEAVANLAWEYRCRLADTNAPLVAALEKANEMNPAGAAAIIRDRVHPGPGGHMVMAAAVLKAWNAPATVADIRLDARRAQLVSAVNTSVSGVNRKADGIAFTHTDGALPWPLDRDTARNPDMLLSLRSTKFENSLNRFLLRITGLPAGNYALKADGQEVARVTEKELNRGVNLAAIAELPENRQASEVLGLARKHNDIHFRRWRQVQFAVSRNNETPPPDVMSTMEALDAQDAEAAEAEHQAAKPKPHTMEAVRVGR